MSNVKRVSITFHRAGYWLLVIVPQQGGAYSERFDRLDTAVELLPHILERFEDLSAPELAYYDHEGSE